MAPHLSGKHAGYRICQIHGWRAFIDPLVRVSEDKWELNGCPEDGPTLAVDQAGVIHIAWATVVNDGEPQKALFYATSRDGKTFSPRARCRLPPGDAGTSTVDAHA